MREHLTVMSQGQLRGSQPYKMRIGILYGNMRISFLMQDPASFWTPMMKGDL